MNEKSTGNKQSDCEELFRGVITRITYRNEQNGFCIIRAESDTTYDVQMAPGSASSLDRTATVVGVIPSTMNAGANFIARGTWESHPKFGRQFKAKSLNEVEPASTEAISRYLAAGGIKGLGPVLAERLVNHFGDETLKIIEQFPERLLEVPGIGEKKLSELKAAWDEKRNLREVLLFFQNHEISASLGTRIYNTYGDRSIEIVKRNPYLLNRDVWGIGFHTADKIALALGLDPKSPERIAAALSYVLKRGADDGHCFLPKDLLLAKAASLLGIDEPELFDATLERSRLDGELIERSGAVYLPHLDAAEQFVAESIAARLCDNLGKPQIGIPAELIERACEQSIVTQNSSTDSSTKVIHLSQEQQRAIRMAATQPITVITGGPGCGKTTIVKTIVSLFKLAGLSIKLAAPTGRAAQRLSEVCGHEASTIHRLLKFDPIQRNFLYDEEETLPLDAIIVDESSMIDILLAAGLLKALPKGIRIVVVGDADQLPSVGPGLFLGDLLSIDQVPRVKLTTLFRRENESSITQIAHSVNAGVLPAIPEPDGVTKSDSYFVAAGIPAEAARTIENLVVDQIPKKFGFKGNEITVLSPMNQGELGIVSLNQRLQSRLVPERPGLPQVTIGHITLRLGDRVCQRVNNYNLGNTGVFNGDQGEIVGIDKEAQSIFVKLWDGREVQYPSSALHQLDLAYALTVHRSQGSEVPVIILAIHESHHILLERQLIYTAITRAKKLLILVGTKKALALAIRRTQSKRRYTSFAERAEQLLRTIRL